MGLNLMGKKKKYLQVYALKFVFLTYDTSFFSQPSELPSVIPPLPWISPSQGVNFFSIGIVQVLRVRNQKEVSYFPIKTYVLGTGSAVAQW